MCPASCSFFKNRKKLLIEELKSDTLVTETQSDRVFRPGYLTEFKQLAKKAFAELQAQSPSSAGNNLTADEKLSIASASLGSLLETVSLFLQAGYFSNDRRIFLKMATYWYAQLLSFCNVGNSQTIRSLTQLKDQEPLLELTNRLANNIFRLIRCVSTLYRNSRFDDNYWQTDETVECENIKLHLELACQLSPTPEATVEYMINNELPANNNHRLLCWLKENDEGKITVQTSTPTVNGNTYGASLTPW